MPNFQLRIENWPEQDTQGKEYFLAIIDAIHRKASATCNSALPAQFIDNMVIHAHQHSNSLRDWLNKLRNSEQGLLRWEQNICDAIGEVDEQFGDKHADFVSLLDLSTEALKTIHYDRK